MRIESHSQVGQDLWAHWMIPRFNRLHMPLLFLDVGCGHPVDFSNTCALEADGWRGWAIDIGADLDLWKKLRPKTTFIKADATVFPYGSSMRSVDYLSLDVDAASLAALRRILECRVAFKVATIEHDAYRFGPEPREEMRRLLQDAGYILERADVEDKGLPFEDWWRHHSIPGDTDAAR